MADMVLPEQTEGTETALIRCVRLEPGMEAEITEISPDPSVLQQMLGGEMELFPLSETAGVLWRKKMDGLPPNRWLDDYLLCGTGLIVGLQDGRAVSLARDEAETYRSQYEQPDDIDSGLMDEVMKSLFGGF